MKDYKYIEFHCPNCGRKISLDIILTEYDETHKYNYHCSSCGNNFNVEYDSVLAKLNINIGIYMKDK